MIDNLINIKQLNIPGKLIYLSQYGSHLYGLDTENSDIDFRGIFIPYKRDVLLKRDKDEINTEIELPISLKDFCNKFPSKDFNSIDDTLNELQKRKEEHGDYCEHPEIPRNITKKVDIKVFSIYKFINLCSHGDTNALDLLFSINTTSTDLWQYRKMETIDGEHKSVIRYIYENRNKLIDTKNMKAYTGYALSQAVKYGVKGTRLKVLSELIVILNRCRYNDNMQVIGDPSLESVQKEIKHLIDNKYIFILDKGSENKGGIQKYLSVLGTEHQFNLPISVVIQRLEAMRDKYAQRTKQAIEGTDWKALSHALRCLYQLEELLTTGDIKYPLKERVFLKDVKMGLIDSECVKDRIAYMLDKIEKIGDPLGWSYDKNFWNKFIIDSINGSNDDTL